MNNSTHPQRGSIIIYALLMLIVLMAMAGTLAGVFLAKVRVITASVRSTIAIFATDTATETCLYEALTQSGPIERDGLLTNGATFTVASLSAPLIDVSSDCRPLGSDNFTFRAVGTYKDISRALEISR